MSLTVKTDDVTKGRKDVDPHGRFRGEWVKDFSDTKFVYQKIAELLVFVGTNTVMHLLQEFAFSHLVHQNQSY